MDTAPGRSGPAMTSASPAAAAASSLIRRALGLCRMLRGWPGEVLDQLAAVSWVGRYQRHEQIMADDPQRREVLVVASGCIAVDHIDASGQHFLLSMYGPGDITSLIRLLTDAPFHFGFHAREPSTVVHLPCDAMMAVLDAHPRRRLAYLPTLDDVVACLGRELRAGDLCLTLGAGDLTVVPDRVRESLGAVG